jgi:membrane protease YdiL (CAAX protease family)
MTDVLPTLPPSPSPVRHSAAGALIAWVVIGLCVTLIVTAGLRPRSPEPLGIEGKKPAAAVREPGGLLTVQSRLAVGMHRMMAGAGDGRSMLTGVDDAAKASPVARLRAAIVAAEVAGNNEALERLDGIAAGPDVPAQVFADAGTLRTIYTSGPAALDAKPREALLEAHGWFARLALSYGLPDEDPARAAALAPALRAAKAAFGVFLGGIVALGVGVVLLVLALVGVLNRSLRPAYVRPPTGRGGPFVESFAVFMAGMVVVSLALSAAFGDRTTGAIPLWANFFLALAVIPAVLWPRLRGLSWAEVRGGFGWHAGPSGGWAREAGLGIVGYVAGLPLLAVALVVTSVLTRVSGTVPSHPIAEEAGAGGLAHVLQLYLLAAVYAPIVEEMMFRGALYHHCRARLPWFAAALLVAVLFAAIHPQGWVGIPMLATVALVLAALREWRGSIIAPMVGHACVNGVTVTMLILMAG